MAEVDDLMALVEGHEFSARVNLASALRLARFITVNAPDVQRLATLCAADRRALATIVERVRDLRARTIPHRFESPWDAALLAYLEVARLVDSHVHRLVAATILSAPQTWWARQASYDDLQARPTPVSDAHVEQAGRHALPTEPEAIAHGSGDDELYASLSSWASDCGVAFGHTVTSTTAFIAQPAVSSSVVISTPTPTSRVHQ